MDYNEKTLPFQKPASHAIIDNVDEIKVTQIRQEEVDFSNAFIKGAKTTAKRMIFHFKAIAGGLTVQILKWFVPSSIDPFYGATFLCSYIGIVMLFPLRKNHLATGLGLITALLVALTGMWPIALLFGGIMTTLLDLIEQKTDNTGFWFTTPLSLLALFYANIKMPESVFASMPIWAYGAMAAVLVAGLLKPQALKHLANMVLMSEADKQAYLENIEAQKALAIAKQQAAKEEQSFALFARHIEVLRLIEVENKNLPPQLAMIVEKIGQQSIDILKIMKADPRDVLPGGQFLNRYLPLIHQSVVRYSTIKSLHSEENIQENIDEKTLIALNGMQQAFTQIRQQLAENDVDDLRVDLKVMDQLIRSQGFEIKD
ncbi:5-bromo-4-chloroindolyl phosphate hydrolysis family protein [Wohlfahrtiimonas larvae]|uniref:5-bromo-4-chloroindolyl phosphate hydrolysis protein n=1 Tax=Wohlfahrtiimonas larvae TaxID=1157986 RepID=A0ABP9MG27_9GAMM|nr:5-bromo-4-chloroindolyl phosphate hydrolysis family protein [Wohlfahrtiimonas larvae]